MSSKTEVCTGHGCPLHHQEMQRVKWEQEKVSTEGSEIMEVCRTCEFSSKAGNDNILSCRRFPPIAEGDISSIANYPSVRHTDWCGEYRQKIE